MGSKASYTPPPASELCCMCGDCGISGELFRCKICSFRSQHKYCSHLYPRIQSYRACNWCLTAEGGRKNKVSFEVEQAIIVGNKTSQFSLAPIVQRSCGGGDGGLKLDHESCSSQINRPAKRQKAERVSTGVGNGRQVFRARVRRYKLLEELCC